MATNIEATIEKSSIYFYDSSDMTKYFNLFIKSKQQYNSPTIDININLIHFIKYTNTYKQFYFINL